MPSLADLSRSWLLKQLGLTSSTLTEADLQAALYAQGTAAGGGLAGNRSFFPSFYYGPNGDSTNITSVAALNTLYLAPFEVGSKTTFDRIALEVTTAGTTGNVLRLGIYTSTQGIPDALVLETAPMDATVLGVKEAIISQSLNPGLYWLGAVSQVGVACNIRGTAASANPYIAYNVYPTSNTYGAFNKSAVAGALPPIMGGISGPTYETPRVCLRAA